MPSDPLATLDLVIRALGGSRRPAQERMVSGVAAVMALEPATPPEGEQPPRSEAAAGTVAGASERGDDGTGTVLMVQAGTGTGKSLGYLVPAARAVLDRGVTVVVATATLALQRQLVTKDLPAVLSGLSGGERVRFAVLKGRGNYLCRARLAGDGSDEADELDLGLSRGHLERQAAALRGWAQNSETGDRDDFGVDVDERVWRSLSATGRECVGPSRCAFAAECFSELARIRAAHADIIVTNHALLAIDALDEVPVVPERDVLVVDEAHELASRATTAGTEQLSVRDLERAVRRARRMVPEDEVEALDEAVAGFADALDGVGDLIRPIPARFVEPLAALRDACHRAVTALPRDDAVPAADRHRVSAALEEVHDIAGRVLADTVDDVAWISGPPRPAVHVAPLSVAGPLGAYLRSVPAAVLTSATLTMGGDFSAIAGELGLAPGQWSGLDVGSPFDYQRQAILYVAADLPAPGRDGLSDAALGRIRELISAAGGRTMVLLSSWRAVDRVAADLRERPLDLPGAVAVHVQRRGEPVARSVEAFGADETSVLVGTMSLFQGVDVPGRACLCVILDRIPFPRPDDPVLAARADRVQERGGNGFLQVSVPRAALLLAQGTGRLIRSTDDRGVVAVLDSRLATARYGGYLRRSLPPFWPTTDTHVALAALARLGAAGVTTGGTR